MQSTKRAKISADFLNALSETQDSIMDAINDLANGDEGEVSRIIMAYKRGTPLKDDKDSVRLWTEFLLSFALGTCGLSADEFENGDYLSAFQKLASASKRLGLASGLDPSGRRKELSVIEAARKNGAKGGKAKGDALKPLWNALKIYWQEKYKDTTKTNNQVAKYLMKTPIFHEHRIDEDKPDQGTVRKKIAEWKKESMDLAAKCQL